MRLNLWNGKLLYYLTTPCVPAPTFSTYKENCASYIRKIGKSCKSSLTKSNMEG